MTRKKTASLSFVRFLPFRCFEEKRRNELFDEKQRIEKIVSVEHKETFSDSGDVTKTGKSTQRSKKMLLTEAEREREREEWENNVRLKRNTEHDEEEALRDPDMKKN